MSIVVGLTGQSGTGKTTVCETFVMCGFCVIDCDKIARNCVIPNSESAVDLENKFPLFFTDGVFDRKKAALMLFHDRELLNNYNAAIFPHINRMICEEIFKAQERGEKYIIIDAPTLFEAGADKFCDCVVSCVAPEHLRLKRIIERDKISEDLAKARMRSQHDEAFFIANSQYILYNDSDAEHLRDQAIAAAQKIKDTQNGKNKKEKI